MWKLEIFRGDELILEHAQNDYAKVLRFGINSLIELQNQNVMDYRITMADKEGRTRLFVVGENTEVATFVNRIKKNDTL